MNSKLIRLLRKDRKLAIGLISGTSIDGIDTVLVAIKGSGINTKILVKDFLTYRISDKLKKAILKNSDKSTAVIDEITRLNVVIGNEFAKAVLSICRKNKLKHEQIDFIGSHGQTIHHLPYKVKSTLQIGDPSVIANLTGIATIGDFRIADCSVNGDGAPLVPCLDYILFRSKTRSRGLLNIGGISNITFLKKNCNKKDVRAFDTGPGNMLIDGFMNKLYGKKFDKDGKIASSGNFNRKLFDYLINDKYYKLKPPKSTGREHYGKEFQAKLSKQFRNIPKKDLIRTITEFTAYSIQYNYRKFSKIKIDELIVSGGGANNKCLMQLLKRYFAGIKVRIMKDYGLTTDNKEAVLFAVLGNECLNGKAANMPSVSGAKKEVILGKICLTN